MWFTRVSIANPVNIRNASGRSGEATVFLTASAGSSTFSGPVYVQNTTIAGGATREQRARVVGQL